jgi:hypothetical protein
MDDGNLVGRVGSTKTTGIGKSVEEVFFYVSSGAWFKGRNWLSVGWELFEGVRTDRQFILPLRSRDMQTFSDKEPSFQQWVTGERKLIAETTMPVTVTMDDDEGFGNSVNVKTGTVAYLIQGAHMFWNGHSARASLVSWSASLGISKDERNAIGRWRPSASDEYIRTSRSIILRVQDTVAQRIRDAGQNDVCHEDGLIRKLALFCKEREMDSAEVEAMIDRIKEGRDFTGDNPNTLPELPIQIEVDAGDTSQDELDECEPLGGWPVLSKGKRVISLTRNDAGKIGRAHV